MIIVVAVAVALVAGAGGWRLRAMRRDLTELRAGLCARTDRRVDMHLTAFRAGATQLDADRARGLEARVHSGETATVQVADSQERLNARLAVLEGRLGPVEAWVAHWAGQVPR